MSKLQYYIDMETRYRKQANIEPDNRERHLASADAWRRLKASFHNRLAIHGSLTLGALTSNGTSRQLVRCSDMSEVGGGPEVACRSSNRRD